MTEFWDRGWAKLAFDPQVLDWVTQALPMARRAMDAPENAHWWTCENTWFVGVDALPNQKDGSLNGGEPLSGAVKGAVLELGYPWLDLHRAQVSVMRPGYPKPRDAESESAFRYRLKRDAAHLDGLLAVGPSRQRKLLEPHAYVLGLPLNPVPQEAAPLVVWEGSHTPVRAAFQARFADVPPQDWQDVDVTDMYKTLRTQVFDTCRRVVVHAEPGESYVLHRHTLHGVAPWVAPDSSHTDRVIAYFRPEFPEGIRPWLEAP